MGSGVDMSKDQLFAAIKINKLEIANRIYMPAMHLNMCRKYQITEQLLAFYAERAKGGVGMISVGYASVDEVAANPMHIGAHDDKYLPGLTSLASTIRENGSLFWINSCVKAWGSRVRGNAACERELK